ncbi:MAG: hypothetical protein LLF94_02565 [Chlamydiales bacterium]|nr:hypothetical protein [Chlamydiales bacterium]
MTMQVEALRTTVESKMDVLSIPTVLKNGGKITVIDIDVSAKHGQDLNLAWFDDLPLLESLAIRVHSGSIINANCFLRPPQHLTDLTIEGCNLTNGVIPSLINMPLKTLVLKDCGFGEDCSNVRMLEKCQTLTSIALDGFSCYKPSTMLGNIHYLTKKMPQTTITPHDTLVDYFDLSKVVSLEKEGSFCYSLQDIKTLTECPNAWNLLALGDKEQEYWEAADVNAHAHNICELSGASPIACGDERVRVAFHHPKGHIDAYKMWVYAFVHNVKVILKLREDGDFYYHPYEKDETLKLDNVTITCEEVERDEKLGCVLRKLKVNFHTTIYHLSLDWEGYQGIAIEKLLPFMQKVEKLEQENPGKTLGHCQAGAGRTGTFFATYILMKLMKTVKFTKNHYFNLEWLLLYLRRQRYGQIESTSQLFTVINCLRKLISLQHSKG